MGEILASVLAKGKSTTFNGYSDHDLSSEQTLNVPFDALTKLVPLKKGTFASRYSQLYLAFIASALLHHYPLLRSGAGNYSTLTYFLIQPLAITCEDLAIHLSTKAGIRSSCKF